VEDGVVLVVSNGGIKGADGIAADDCVDEFSVHVDAERCGVASVVGLHEPLVVEVLLRELFDDVDEVRVMRSTRDEDMQVNSPRSPAQSSPSSC
jgi:hypothetical protein